MEGIGTVAMVGGFLLAIVLVWAVIMNQRRSRRAVEHTEEATRALYEQVDRQDKVSDPDPKTY